MEKKPVNETNKLLPNISLSLEEEQLVNDIMDVLAADRIPGIDRQAIENLIATGFNRSDILAAILHWRSLGWSTGYINGALAEAFWNSTRILPFGMTTIDQLASFIATLREGLQKAGYPCVAATLGGSAITGEKYATNAPFDQGRVSDYDIAICDPLLLAQAEKLGVGMRGDRTRSDPLDIKNNGAVLKKLGLYDLFKKLGQISGRKVSLMIYNSTVTVTLRQPSVILVGRSC